MLGVGAFPLQILPDGLLQVCGEPGLLRVCFSWQPLFFHLQRQQLFQGEAQGARKLHQRTAAAPLQLRPAGTEIGQGGPGDTAGFGKLVTGQALFFHHLLQCHIHHQLHYIGVPIESQRRPSPISCGHFFTVFPSREEKQHSV